MEFSMRLFSSKVEDVKNARDNHIKWEEEKGFDPNEDWSNKETVISSD